MKLAHSCKIRKGDDRKKLSQVNLCEGGLVPDEGGDMGDADLVRHALRYFQYLDHQYLQYLGHQYFQYCH